MNAKSTLFLTRGALIAALYVALTFASALFGLASGAIQFRISEMLCILPIFMPEAVVGLTLGCLIANLSTNAVIWDVVFGTLATLIGAVGTRLFRKLPKKLIWLAPLPTVLANAIIVPFVLIFAYGASGAYHFLMLTVAIGEVVCAWVMGLVLYYSLLKIKFFNKV
ncbi:MAG: QueT transporter family protein [Ruminococcaceae bacterium]|nr:QueT transporter family protein [Oscillospiraceae bacterium]